jgi:hypothetical protein
MVRCSTPYDMGAGESTGIAAVMEQASDEKGRRAWYLAQAEWLEFPSGSRTLWLPVGVVVKA